MQTIKNFVKANLKKDSLETIFWGEPTKQDYEGAVKFFRGSEHAKKVEVEERIMRKMKKGK